MCPLAFKARRGRPSRRNRGFHPTSHPLTPILSEPLSSLSSPQTHGGGLLQRTSPNDGSSSPDVPAQHASAPAGSSHETRGAVSSDASEPSVTVRQQILGSPPATGSSLAQTHLQPQNDPSAKRNTSLGEPVLADDLYWFCHICNYGRQTISTTPACTNVLATGICGHGKCDLCRTE